MALDNNFQALAEQFLTIYMDEDGADWDDDELETRIRGFLSKQGIDDAWLDEAYEVVYNHLGEACDWS